MLRPMNLLYLFTASSCPYSAQQNCDPCRAILLGTACFVPSGKCFTLIARLPFVLSVCCPRVFERHQHQSR
uniref:U37-Liphistoxin-Lth1b_1 n=1 Tax=Liphistius thaleban TaxID=1905330 RepID=A0A4Q8K6I2_9ARAC